MDPGSLAPEAMTLNTIGYRFSCTKEGDSDNEERVGYGKSSVIKNNL